MNFAGSQPSNVERGRWLTVVVTTKRLGACWMIPFKDTVPVHHTPWVTWGLIALNVAVFLEGQLLDPDELRSFQYLHGLVAARYVFPDWAITAGFPLDYTPFLTNMFLHGGWLHLIFNMWLLWIFGDNIEDRMGKVRYLAFYVVCGLSAGVAHVYANQLSITPTIGAQQGTIMILNFNGGMISNHRFQFTRKR